MSHTPRPIKYIFNKHTKKATGNELTVKDCCWYVACKEQTHHRHHWVMHPCHDITRHHRHHWVMHPCHDITTSMSWRHFERSCTHFHAKLWPLLCCWRSGSIVQSQVHLDSNSKSMLLVLSTCGSVGIELLYIMLCFRVHVGVVL